MKPLEKYWTIQGLRIAIFLDDGWAIVQDREGFLIKAQVVSGDLFNAGFVVNIGVRAGGARGAAAPPNFGQHEKIWAKPEEINIFYFNLKSA